MLKEEKVYQFLQAYKSMQLENFADSLFEECKLTSNQVHWLDQCDSTSEFIKKELTKNIHEPIICVSDIQTQGKGQRNNTWNSPLGNLYFSMYIPIGSKLTKDQNLNYIDGRLSLEMAIALLNMQMLQTLKLNSDWKVGVKWPNDLCVLPRNNKKSLNGLNKFAGVLIEPVSIKPKLNKGSDITLAELPRVCGVIIGIGINANDTETHMVDDRPIQNLQSLLQHTISLPDLAAQTCQACQKALDSFFTHSSSLPIRYFAYDLLYDKKIKIKQFGDMLEGVATGIQEDGALTLMASLEETFAVHTGDIQLN